MGEINFVQAARDTALFWKDIGIVKNHDIVGVLLSLLGICTTAMDEETFQRFLTIVSKTRLKAIELQLGQKETS